MRILERFWRDHRGNLTVLFGLTLLPFVSLAGSAVDYSRATLGRAQLQRATDQAALTAATLKSPSDSQRVSIAQSALAVALTPNDPTPIITSNGGIITVDANRQIKTDFLGVIGVRHMVVSAHSRAAQSFNGPPVCVFALDKTASSAISFAGNAAFSAANCALYSDSSSASAISVQGSASVQAAGYCSVGGVSSPKALTPAAQTACPYLSDPFQNVGPPTSTTCDSSNRNTVVAPNTTRGLYPGVYCGGLNLKGTATLSPGLYVIKDGPLSIGSQANVSISGAGGVTFYLVGQNAGLSMNGGGGVSLTAQTTGPYAGLLIIQDRNSNIGATSTLNGDSNTLLRGGLYLPTQTLSVTGNNSFGQQSNFMPIVANKVSFSGSSAANLDLTAMNSVAPVPRFGSSAVILE